ncbi:MAG: ABC transporter substrate-binding protein, partial [Candidatus Bathyarchaeia archaeon]
KEKLTFERFPDYWEGWRPKYFGKGIYQVIRESATMKVLLQNREIDYTDQWQGVKFYDEVEKFPGVKVYRDPQISALQVFLNGRNEFISNKDFRYALCYAFPYEDVLREVFMGRFPKMKGPLPASIWSHTSDLMVFNHDMEKAREYFDKSGFSEGEVELGWVDVGIEERRRIGLIYQEKLAELGINLRIDKIEWAALQDVTSKLETTPDTMIILRGIPYGDPDAYMYHHYHSSVWKTHPSYISMCRYENAEVDKLLDQAREIVDIGKRTELYVKAQKIIAEDAPAIYIHDGIREVAMQESVQGYSAFGNPSFYTSLNWRWNNWWRA